MKIYENANDQHVRKVVLYEVSTGLAFDKAGTELLTKEQIVDAFLKGCVVENEGNYKTPTGVNVTDEIAELVFGGGGSGGPEVENAIATHGLGWTESEPKEGFDITWDGDTEGLETFSFNEHFPLAYKVSDKIVTSIESLIGSKFTMVALTASYDYEIPTNNGNKTLTNYGESMREVLPSFPDMFAFGPDVEHDVALGYIFPVDIDVDVEDFDIHMHASAGIYFAKGDTEGIQYAISRLYKEASTEEVVHQIDQKYIPSGSSGGGGMVVTVDFVGTSETPSGEADKTVDEIMDAYEAGTNVVAKFLLNGEDIGDRYSLFANSEGMLIFGFPIYTMKDGDISSPRFAIRAWHDSDEDIDVWQSDMIN